MRTSSEPRHPPAHRLALIDEVAETIAPDDPALESWFEGYRVQHRSRLAADLELVSRHVAPAARLLECGAAPLLATAALARLDYRVSAVDLAPARFAGTIARLGLGVRTCDIETEPLPFADESFDAALFNELFEHLRIQPIRTMREVARVLRPGGVLLLSTPNLRSFRGLRNLLLRNQGHAVSAGVYRQYEKLDTLGHMGHVREYTSREVSSFLGHVGFDVAEIVYRGGHGRGFVGLAERIAPSFRPFISLIATRRDPGS